jgi:hypothetical protein
VWPSASDQANLADAVLATDSCFLHAGLCMRLQAVPAPYEMQHLSLLRLLLLHHYGCLTSSVCLCY